MPPNQRIALEMVAQMDAGNIESQATDIAQKIAGVFERELGKIAEAFMRKLGESTQMMGGVSGARNLDFTQPITAQMTGPQPPPFSGAGPGAGMPPSFSRSFGDPFSTPGYYLSQMMSGQSPDQLMRADLMSQQARGIVGLREAGINVPVGKEQATEMRELAQVLRETARESLGAEAESIKDLRSKIGELNKTIADNTQSQAERERAEKAKSDAVMQVAEKTARSTDAALQAARQAENLEAAAATPGGGMGRQFGMAALQSIGAIAPVIGNWGSLGRAGEVGAAQAGNVMARAALGGDLGRMMAIDAAGGEAALQAQGRHEAQTSVAMSLLGAGVGAGMSAFGGVGAIAGIPMAMGLGTQALTQMRTFGALQAQKQEEILRAQMTGPNAERMQVALGGTQTALQAFRASQGLGGGQLAEMLAGGGQFADLRETMGGLGVEYGGFMQRTAGALGGSFFGESQSRLGSSLMQPRIAQLAKMEALGLQGAPELAGMFMGGMGVGEREPREMATDRLQKMFEEAVSSGMDRSKVSGYLMTVGQAASQLGVGGAAVAEMQSRQDLAISQSLYGKEGMQGPLLARERQIMGTATAMTQAGSGLGGVAGLRAARDLMAKMNIRGDAIDEMELQSFTVDAAGLQKFAQKHGKSLSDTEAERIVAEHRANQAGRLRAAYREQFGDKLGDLEFARATGAQLLSQEQETGAVVERGVAIGAAGPKAVGPGGKAFKVGETEVGGLGADLAINLEKLSNVSVSAGLNVKVLGDNVAIVNTGMDVLIQKLMRIGLTPGAVGELTEQRRKDLEQLDRIMKAQEAREAQNKARPPTAKTGP